MSQKENNKQQEQERIKEWLDAVTDIIAFNAIGAAIHVNNGKLPEIIFQEITDEETILDVKGLANIQNWADVPDKIAIQYNPQLLAEAGIKAPEYLQQAMDEALQQPHSVISKNHYVSYVTEPDDNNSLSFYEEIFDEQSQPAGYFKHTFRTEAQKNKYVQSHNINYQQTPDKPVIVNNIQHKQQYLAGPKNSNYGMQLPQPFNSNLPVQNKGAITDPNDLSQPQPGQILIDKTYPPEDIRSVIQKVGKENFFSKTNFDDIDVEYNWSSDGKKADMYKSCTQFSKIKNAHQNQGCFPIIQLILEAVLGTEQLEKVKYSATQKRIVLPKSAWTAKQIGLYSLPNNPYQDYIRKVLFNIMNSTDPATEPRNQKELIFFAIQKIKADYQVARYSNGQSNNIDEDLLEYWGKTGQYIQGDSSHGMKWKNPVALNLEPLIRQPNKETIQSYRYDGGGIGMQVENGFLSSIERNLQQIYSKPLNKEDHWYSPVENESVYNPFHSWYKGIITDNMLQVYKNAATLAALDGNTFPSTDKNQNGYYLWHAELFTLFKLHNKKLLDYVEPDPNAPQHAFSDNKGSNPFQIDKMAINTEGRGCRKLTNKRIIADNDEIIQCLCMFAWAGIPLEKNVDFDEDCDPQLKKFYQKMEQGTPLLFKKDPDYYDVSSIRQEIIKRAVRWGLQNNQDPADVIKELACNLEQLLKNGVPWEQQTKPWSELHAVILNYVSKAFEQQRKRYLDSIKISKPVICLQKNGQTHTYDIYFQYNNGQPYKAPYSLPFFPKSSGQDAIVVQLYINDRFQEQLVPIDGQWHSLAPTTTVAPPVNQGQVNNNGNQQFGTNQFNNANAQATNIVDVTNLQIKYDTNGSNDINILLDKRNSKSNSTGKELISTKSLHYAIAPDTYNGTMCFWVTDLRKKGDNITHYTGIPIKKETLSKPCPGCKVPFTFLCNGQQITLYLKYEHNHWHPFPNLQQQGFIGFCNDAFQQPAVVNNINQQNQNGNNNMGNNMANVNNPQFGQGIINTTVNNNQIVPATSNNMANVNNPQFGQVINNANQVVNPQIPTIKATYENNTNVIDLDSLGIQLHKNPNNTYTVKLPNGNIKIFAQDSRLKFNYVGENKGELWIVETLTDSSAKCQIAKITDLVTNNNQINIEYHSRGNVFESLPCSTAPAELWRGCVIPLETIVPPQDINVNNSYLPGNYGSTTNSDSSYISTTGNNNINQQYANNINLYNGAMLTETESVPATNEQPIEVDLTGLNMQYNPNKKGEIMMQMRKNNGHNPDTSVKRSVSIDNLMYSIDKCDGNIYFWIADKSQKSDNGLYMYYAAIPIDSSKLPNLCPGRTIKFKFTCGSYHNELTISYKGGGWYQLTPELKGFFLQACQKPAVVNNGNKNYLSSMVAIAETASVNNTTGTDIQQQPDVIVDLNNFTLTKSQGTFICKNNTTGGLMNAEGLCLELQENGILLIGKYGGNLPINKEYIKWKDQNNVKNVKKMQIKFNGQLFMVDIQDGKCEIPQEVINTWKSLCQQQQPVNNSNNINNLDVNNANKTGVNNIKNLFK